MKNHIRPSAKVVYGILFVLLLVFSIWIIKPFLLSIIGGLILAYLFYPIYARINKKVKREWLSAAMTSILIVLLFTLPLAFLVGYVSKDATVSYLLIKQKLSTGIAFGRVDCAQESFGCSVINNINNWINDPQINFYANDVLSRTTTYLVSRSSDFIITIPQKLVALFIMLFVMYYSLKDGRAFVQRLESLVSLRRDHKTLFEQKIRTMIYSTVYGTMLVALIQGIVAGIGFLIFGFHNPVLLGLLAALASMIPMFGTALVWGPAALILIFDGISLSQTSFLLRGFGLALYGMLIVSLIDNFARPLIIGKKASLHPVIVLIGILGGIAAFGFIGILLGPMIIALFVTFAEIYKAESEGA